MAKAVGLCLFASLLPGVAMGQTNLTWGPGGAGGSGNANATNAWWNGTSQATWNNNNTNVVFQGTAGTVLLGNSMTAQDVQFNTPGYTLVFSSTSGASSRSLTLNSFSGSALSSTMLVGSTSATATAVNISTSGNVTFTGTIADGGGSTSLAKSGTGRLAISNYTATGRPTITAGTLRLDSAFSFSPALRFNPGSGTTGILELAAGNYSANFGSSATGGLEMTSNTAFAGFAAIGGSRTVTMNNSTNDVTWRTAASPGQNAIAAAELILGTADSTGKLTLTHQNAGSGFGLRLTGTTGTETRTIRVAKGSEPIDAEIAMPLKNGTSGTGALTKVGSGVLALSAVNGYTGATTVSDGTLLISSGGQINGSSGITVNGSGAQFKYNSATALTQPLTVTQGTVSGTGTISASGGVTIGTNATLSPGNSPGTQAFTTGLTMAAGGSYLWEINDWTGTQGVDPGWDLLAVSGSPLNITSSSSSVFAINLTSLTGSNTAGVVPNFNGNASKTFTIATAGSITGFDASAFTLNTTQFSSFNPNSGSWSITSTGTTLLLNYIVAPTTTTGSYSLAASAGAATIIAGGSSTITATITNTGAGTADALNYGSLAVGQGVSISPSTGSNLAQAASGTGTGVFTTSAPGAYSFDPTASVTNATLGGAAVLSGSTATSVTVLDHATSSLLGSGVLTSGTLNLGTWDYVSASWTSGSGSDAFSIFNLNPNSLDPSFVALLNLTGTSASGDSGFTLDPDLNPASFAMIAGGTSASYSVSYDPTGMNTQGTFSRTFTFQMADQNLPGGQATNTLTVTANVVVVPEPGTMALAGLGLGVIGFAAWRRRRRSAA